MAVDLLSGACALKYTTFAAIISASVEGIMTQLLTSVMSASTAWWD